MSFVLVGAPLQTSAFAAAYLVIGCIIMGFCTGIDSSTVDVSTRALPQGEAMPHRLSGSPLHRHRHSGAYWIDFRMSYTSGSIALRLPISLQLVLAITVIILLLGLPESPRWLCKCDKDQEAIEVLRAIYDPLPDDPYIQSEIAAIRKAVSIERAEGASKILSLFNSGRLKTRRCVILTYFGLLMNQMSGISLVIYYMLSPSHERQTHAKDSAAHRRLHRAHVHLWRSGAVACS